MYAASTFSTSTSAASAAQMATSTTQMAAATSMELAEQAVGSLALLSQTSDQTPEGTGKDASLVNVARQLAHWHPSTTAAILMINALASAGGRPDPTGMGRILDFGESGCFRVSFSVADMCYRWPELELMAAMLVGESEELMRAAILRYRDDNDGTTRKCIPVFAHTGDMPDASVIMAAGAGTWRVPMLGLSLVDLMRSNPLREGVVAFDVVPCTSPTCFAVPSPFKPDRELMYLPVSALLVPREAVKPGASLRA